MKYEIQNLKRNVEHMALEWKAQLYLMQFAHKNILDIEGVRVTAWEPKNIVSEFDYLSSYRTAIQRNQAIFEQEISQVEFVRVTTTDQYNKYRQMFVPQATQKKKGDGLEGSSVSNKIVLIDYSALPTETSLLQDHGSDEASIKSNYQQIITHELAHLNTRRITGKHQRQMPSWFYEGLAVFVGPQKPSIPRAGSKSLKERLTNIKGDSPNDEELWKRENNGRPMVYLYATELLKWVFAHHTAERIPYSEADKPEDNVYAIPRIKLLVEIVRRIGTGQPFDTAFTEVFGINYQEAHNQFVVTL